MAGLNAKFVLLKDTFSIHDPGQGDDSKGVLLSAGCLLEEISDEGDPATDQLLLGSLDHATGGSLFVHASLADLQEVSTFSSKLLLAEKQLKMRLIVCRDENWLEEARHMFEDTEVLVTVGPAQFLAVIHFAGEMEDRRGRWFGVEIKPSLLVNVENLVEGGDGFPEFECQSGRGLYVTISAVRLAEPVLDVPFKGQAAGKKGFSFRSLKAADIKKTKMINAARKNEAENVGTKFDCSGYEEKVQRGLEVDDRVVWFGAEDGPARGTVRFVGRTNSKDEKNKIAVEFDERVGDKDYTGMTNGFGQFSIKSGYGRLLNPSEVMNEVDFGYEQTVIPLSEKKKTSSKTETETSMTDGNSEQPLVAIGSRVIWFKAKDDPVRGKVSFIGKLRGKKNFTEKVGVHLDVCKGPNGFTGKNKGKSLFVCEPGFGVLTDMDSLMSEKEYDMGFGITSDGVPEELDTTQLKVKDKIVWIDPKDQNKRPQYGTVLFLGEVDGLNGIQLGIEFQNPCGQKDWTGKFKKKQHFTCKSGHGRFLPHEEHTWFRKEDYERRKTELETEVEPTTEMEIKNLLPVKVNDQSQNTPSDVVATAIQSADAPFTTVKTIKNFSIGDRVVVKLNEELKIGVIRWMGIISAFTRENLVGLEMDDLVGSPNNLMNCGFAGNAERGYLEVFLCKPGHGTFVSPNDVSGDGKDDRYGQETEDDASWTEVSARKKPVSSQPLLVCETIYIPPEEPKTEMSVVLQTPPVAPIDFQKPVRHVAPSAEDDRVQRSGLLPIPQPDLQFTLQIGQLAFTFFGATPVRGIVKWIGCPHFSPSDVHVGLQLLQKVEGTPGGTVDGVNYFEALAGFGAVIPLVVVHPIAFPKSPVFGTFSTLRPRGLQGSPSQRPSNHFQAQQQPQLQMVKPSAAPRIRPPAAVSMEPIDPPEHVLRALREADLKERAMNERMDHVAVFALQAEDHGAFTVTVDDKDRTKGFVKFLLKPSPETEPYCVTRITLPEMDGAGNGHIGLPKKVVKDIEFFPPLFLRFHLTEGFPQHLPPVYTVDCNWITDVQVNKLREHLMGIWRESVDLPERNILLESMRHLKKTLLGIMGLEFGIVYLSKLVAEFETADSHLPGGRCLYDTDNEVMGVFSRLTKFNDKECRERDEKEQIECSICASAVSPHEISFFSTLCTHEQMFCKECISNHVKAQVENGNTTEIKCMDDGCRVLSTVHDLVDLIKRDVFEEMNPQLNSRLLDKMADVRRCPSCGCAVIFDQAMIGNERYITCPSQGCGIQYCPNCKGKSHGEQPCLSTEKKRELRNQFLGAATQEAKNELIRQYGQENIDHAIEDYDAEEYIRTHGKPCPSCKSPTEKIDGCNKMKCTVCNTFFCYICGLELSKVDPYGHFSSGTCAKFDR